MRRDPAAVTRRRLVGMATALAPSAVACAAAPELHPAGFPPANESGYDVSD